MGLYLVLLHLQAWRHRASTRGLASLLPAAEATCALRELLPGPLLNAGTPIFHSYRPSAPLPPELSAHARRLRLCSAPRTLHLDQASLLSKVLLSESSRYIGRRPCTWPTFHRASRPQSWAHWGGDEADGVGVGVDRSRAAPSLSPCPAPVAIPGSCCSGHLGRGGGEMPSCHHFMLLLGK